MKLRLFLFLFLASTLLAGTAMAQGCTTTPDPFPLQGDPDKEVISGKCLTNNDTDNGVTQQGGRLRWQGSVNTPGTLQLFDADDDGHSLWCAIDKSTGVCAQAELFCLQQDGNAVLYQGDHTFGTPHCGDVGSNPTLGRALWASNTQGANDNHEVLDVEEEDPLGILWNNTRYKGDRAVVRNQTTNNGGVQWLNTGQNSAD
jgi:hypothetical protein